MFYIALLILSFFYFFSLTVITFPIRVSRNVFLYIWACYVFALAVIGYYIEPSAELDLFRMYNTINELRAGQATVLDSSPFLILNVMYWLVSQTENNSWYAVLSILIIGSLEFAIINKYIQNGAYVPKIFALFFLGCNANGFIVYTFIGRSFLVAVVFVYAYYVWRDVDKKIFWGLTIVCCLIHILGLVFMLFSILYELTMSHKLIRYGCILCIIIILHTNIPLQLFSLIPGEYSSLVLEKYQAYSIRGFEFQQPVEMWFRTINLLYALICLLYLQHIGNTQYEIWIFFTIITFCGFNFSIIYERMPFVIGVAMLPILQAIFMNVKRPVNAIIYYTLACIWFGQTLWGIREAYAWLSFNV